MSLSLSEFIKQIADAYEAEHVNDPKAPVSPAKEPKICKRCWYADYSDTGLVKGGYCSDCQRCVDRGYDIVEMAGRCANGGQLDSGIVFHAILMENDTDIFDYTASKAVCGTAPGKRSVGWSTWKPEDREVTCPRCLARLERLGK